MLDLNYDITHLRGAEYNPRYIDDNDLTMLADSIKELGLVKPLIVRGDLLVAGHQRTKALRRLGVTTAAVYVLPVDTTTYDEVRFNQLHNGTDMDNGDEQCFIAGLGGLAGFTTVKASAIRGNLRAKMAYIRKSMAEMIIKYGSWGGVVATQSGEVIHCAQYALAAKLTNSVLTVYVIKDADKAKYLKFLSREYGVFSYEHLEKTTYIQTYAQMMRLRQGKKIGGSMKSRLYERHVIPYLLKQGKGLRGIDFGSGQGDYARHLRSMGVDLHDVELFRRKGASNTIDLATVNRMIDKMCSDVANKGLYDYVICDSVLNSVDCLQAEQAVMSFIKGLCKPEGLLFFSGRCREAEEYISKQLTQAASKHGRISFCDNNGFTAQYRKGHWFYQKFHTKEDVKQLITRHGLKEVTHVHDDTSFQVVAVNDRPVEWPDLSSAICYEFELPLSGDRQLQRSDDVLRAFSTLNNN